jgi:hypothetical protein
MVKLTKREVDALKTEGKELVCWDDETAGFGVRVKATGAKSWIIQYRNTHGRSRRLTIGKVGRLTPEQARKEAKQKLAAVDRGGDPADAKAQARKALTVAQAADQYLEAGRGRIKASTLKMDESRIERHVKPLLGSRPVASLTPADMEKFLRDIIAGKTAAPKPKPSQGKGKVKRARGGITTGGPGVASRTLGMLGTILERAVRDGVISSNPVRGIKRPKEQEVKPAFSFDKIKALGAALRGDEAENAATEYNEAKVGREAIRGHRRPAISLGCPRCGNASLTAPK